MSAHALAIDIGGTSIRFGLINDAGQLIGSVSRHDVPFRVDGSADPQSLIELMHPYVAGAVDVVGNHLAIGLSVCGNIDMDTGEAVLVPNLHWQNVPFGRMVAERFNRPVFAATDVRQAAIAEAVWGVARGVRNFVWVTVGTGYGGYLFLNGRLYGGSHRFAGNFGHITHDEINGYRCGCGRWGCVETFVSGPAIARAGQSAVAKQRSPKLAELAGGGNVTTNMVFQAADAGDGAARQILDEVIRLICINIGGVVNLLDLDMVVFGGGVVHAAPWFLEQIRVRVRDYLMTVEARRDLRVEMESFPNSALWGAAANVFVRQGILEASILE